MKKVILSIVTVGLSLCINAQDVHFAQFWNNSIQYNPGMAGMIPANLRIATSYRNQWASVASPYKTFAFNADTRFDMKGSASLGAGLSVYKDVAGDTEFGTTNILLSLSGILELDRHNKLSLGVSGGMLQKNINTSNLQWGSQYQGGQYNATLDPNENINMEPGMKGDVSAGLVYVYHSSERYMSANDQLNVQLGFAVNHIARPRMDWTSAYTDTLHRNFVGSGQVNVGVGNSRLTLVPGFLMFFQGPSKEIMIGSQFKYRLQEASKVTGFVKGAYLSLGTYLRLGDAFIPSVSLDFDKYSLGVSYDVNVSSLRTASNGKGGFEISLKFRSPNPYLWQGAGKASFR